MLRHSSDTEPGITRQRIGRHWAYFDPAGERVTDRAEIDRLNAIGLPPAYTDAWFCTDPDGHLQATGIDARGRKQYRYHPLFREHRERAKFKDLRAFGEAISNQLQLITSGKGLTNRSGASSRYLRIA